MTTILILTVISLITLGMGFTGIRLPFIMRGVQPDKKFRKRVNKFEYRITNNKHMGNERRIRREDLTGLTEQKAETAEDQIYHVRVIHRKFTGSV